jgi:hypothetical protein
MSTGTENKRFFFRDKRSKKASFVKVHILRAEGPVMKDFGEGSALEASRSQRNKSLFASFFSEKEASASFLDRP